MKKLSEEEINKLVAEVDSNHEVLSSNEIVEKVEQMRNHFEAYQNVVFDFLNTNNLGDKYYEFVKDLKRRAENDHETDDHIDLYGIYGDIDSVYEDVKLIWGWKGDHAE